MSLVQYTVDFDTAYHYSTQVNRSRLTLLTTTLHPGHDTHTSRHNSTIITSDPLPIQRLPTTPFPSVIDSNMFSTPHQTDYGDGYAGDDERSPYTFENVFDAQNSTPATPATPAAAAPPPSATTHGMLYRNLTFHQCFHRHQEDSSPANTSLFSTVSSRPTELQSSSASAHASPHDKWAPASSTAFHDVLNDQESRSVNLGLGILLGEPATPVLFGAATIADAIHKTSDGQPGADQIAHAFPQLHLGSPAVIDQTPDPLGQRL